MKRSSPWFLSGMLCLAISQVSLRANDLNWGQADDLVVLPAVEKELTLTEEQKSRIKSALDAPRETEEQRANRLKQVRDSLDDKQWKRLGQVRIQVLDGLALQDSQVADQLDLNEDQKKQLKEAEERNQAAQAELLDLLKRVRFPNAAARRKVIQKYRTEGSERMLKILTEAQQKKFQELKGAPLEAEVTW